MNVDAMLETMETGQLDEWMAYRRLEKHPLQKLRETLAMVGSTLTKADPEAFLPETDYGTCAGPAQARAILGMRQ